METVWVVVYWLIGALFLFFWVGNFFQARRSTRMFAKLLNTQPKFRLYAWVVRGRYEGREVFFTQYALPFEGGMEFKMACRGEVKRQPWLVRYCPMPTSATLLRGRYVHVSTDVLQRIGVTEDRLRAGLENLARGCDTVEANDPFFR
jgi:hypothetical protein